MKRKRDAERSRGSEDATAFVFIHYTVVFCYKTEDWIQVCLVFCCIFVPPVLSSDITTLTSASYQSSLPMHAGQHLLSIQGKAISSVMYHLTLCGLSVRLAFSFKHWSHHRTHPFLCISQAVQWATVGLAHCLENETNSCSQLLWFQWVKGCFKVVHVILMTDFSDISRLRPFAPASSPLLGTSLSDAGVQLRLSRARTVQRRPGGPRTLWGGSVPASLHLRPWTICTCQLC